MRSSLRPRSVLGRIAQMLAAVPLLLGAAAFAAPPNPYPEASALAREGKHAEAAAALEAYLKTNRFDGSAWSTLGYELHADKQYAKAREAYQRALDLGYQPETQAYNTACTFALTGQSDQALQWLKRAFELRFAEQETLLNDTDLDALRTDPRFAELTGLTAKLPKPLADGRDAGWRWDLDFLVRRMEQMHWDLYAHVTKERFATEIEQLKKDLPTLSEPMARLRLQRVIAMVGDGHTQLHLAAENETSIARYPIHLFEFADGLHVMGAAKEHAELVGSRVAAIGDKPIAEVAKAAGQFISRDNDMHLKSATPARLCNPTALLAVGAAKADDAAEFTLETSDGKQRRVTLKPTSFPARGQGGLLIPNFVYAHQSLAPEQLPLYLQNTSKRQAIVPLPEHKAVYFWFGAVQEDRESRFADVVAELFSKVDGDNAETLIIDMRFNGGGNTGLVQPLLTGLIARPRLNRPGGIYVIIGRGTYSAAQNTVNMIETMTRATFVGEPTASRPNFVGESTWFVLPHTNLRVRCSSRYWQFNSSTDQRTWVHPQIAAEPTYADYAAGRDPCVEAILKSMKSRRDAASPTQP